MDDLPPPPPSSSSLLPVAQPSFLAPSPHLPMEMKREILRSCDPATLAKTSLVSMAFLELSTPFLYGDISIDGFDTAEKLFCSRADRACSSSLNTLLSLRNINSFTFTTSYMATRSPPALSFSTDRFPNGRPSLPLPGLVVQLRSHRHGTSSLQRDPRLFLHLLPLLDPVVVHFTTLPPVATSGSYDLHVDVMLSDVPWKNLQSLTFTSVASSEALGKATFFDVDPQGRRDLVVVYDPRQNPKDGGEMTRFDLRDRDKNDMFKVGNRLKEVVVRFGSVEEREVFDWKIRASWMEGFTGDVAEQARRKSFMRYEVDEEDST